MCDTASEPRPAGRNMEHNARAFSVLILDRHSPSHASQRLATEQICFCGQLTLEEALKMDDPPRSLPNIAPARQLQFRPLYTGHGHPPAQQEDGVYSTN